MRLCESKIDRRNCEAPHKGFTLIELLIVVAVILVIAAIAIPNFIQSKMRANESSAMQNLRNVNTSELVYSTTYGIGYSTDLAKLSGNGITVDQNNAGLIDSVLAGGTKSGYAFTYTVLSNDTNGNPMTYSFTADPLTPGSTGKKFFYTDQTGVIRYNLSVPAGPSDGPVQ